MRLGIVGSEEAKFTMSTYVEAQRTIWNLIAEHQPEAVVSGGCHLGGIDQWAKEEALILGIRVIEHLPACLNWSLGYKPRNLKIAQDSDLVVCITVKEFPPNYTGMRFPYCYHCKTDQHIKSGGCWTVKQAIKMGKKGQIVVI